MAPTATSLATTINFNGELKSGAVNTGALCDITLLECVFTSFIPNKLYLLTEKLRNSGEIREKPSVIASRTKKTHESFLVLWSWTMSYRFQLGTNWFYLTLSKDMPQISDLCSAKLTFGEIDDQLSSTQSFTDGP